MKPQLSGKPHHLFGKYPPIQRHGVSTPENPLPAIAVNTAYETDAAYQEELALSTEGCDGWAPFPYQISVMEEGVRIYSGDGRLIALVPRSSFASREECLLTARMLAYSFRYAKVANELVKEFRCHVQHNTKPGKQVEYPPEYLDLRDTLYEASKDLYYIGVIGGFQYEPAFYNFKGDEYKTERGMEDQAPHNPPPQVEEIIARVPDDIFDAADFETAWA